MTPETLESRVDRLEQRVTLLEQLPARVDALAGQILQLRDEMRGEFSALRSEIRAGDEETRLLLLEAIRGGDDRILNQSRMLYEDLVSKLALIAIHANS